MRVKFKHLFRATRYLLLLALLACVYMLYVWNRDYDPRFYVFLESKPGQLIGSVMGWRNEGNYIPRHKSEDTLLDEEKLIKAELEKEMAASWPTHEVKLTNGETMQGRMLAASEKSITFLETYGDTGAMKLNINRKRIKSLNVVEEKPPAITYRDIRLKQELPELNFNRNPPYSILTDENYFKVQNSVAELQKLRKSFSEVYASLIQTPELGDNIQVVFFSDEAEFRKYQEKYVPNMPYSSGFYNESLDRLILFNHNSSSYNRSVQHNITTRADKMIKVAKSSAEVNRLNNWKNSTRRIIERESNQQTLTTLRHEGAHQLFYTYGVHSDFQAENPWLIEGLAVYSETKQIGDLSKEHLLVLTSAIRNNNTIPLVDLINSRHTNGFFVFEESNQVVMAYAQSWALVHMLMQPKYQERFFDYLRYIRERKNVREIATKEPAELLFEKLGVDRENFRFEYDSYIIFLRNS